MPRKQLNIGLTPEQRAQVDEIATALDTTPTEFARSAILETVQLQRALTAEDRADVLAAADLGAAPSTITRALQRGGVPGAAEHLLTIRRGYDGGQERQRDCRRLLQEARGRPTARSPLYRDRKQYLVNNALI